MGSDPPSRPYRWTGEASVLCGVLAFAIPIGLSCLAFYVGPVALLFLVASPILAVIGIVFGRGARADHDTSGSRRDRGAAAFGLGLCYSYFLLLLLFFGFTLTRKPEPPCRATCQNQLKQMGIVFAMYSGEAKGAFPELSHDANGLIFDGKPLYPEYLTDPNLLRCPSSKEPPIAITPALNANPGLLINDESYTYLGYVVTNEAELEAFSKAYKDRVAKGLPFDSDLDVTPGAGLGGGYTIPRLCEGVENALTLDASDDAAQRAKSTIPVMWDRCQYDPTTEPEKWFPHPPGGANVLYMDGHVEFIKYPGRFPLTECACRILGQLHRQTSVPNQLEKP